MKLKENTQQKLAKAATAFIGGGNGCANTKENPNHLHLGTDAP
jgi:hypothetical protein